jgi:hypothetical protein
MKTMKTKVATVFALAFTLMSTLSYSLTFQSEAQDSMVSNYEFSGPLFALLRKYDSSVSLSHLDEMYENSSGDPIYRMLDVSSKEGVAVTMRTLESQDVRRIPTPSLIVVKTLEEGRPVHGFILAEGHTEEGLLVYEFRQNLKWRYIPYAVLESQFTGTVVFKKRSFFGFGFVELLVFLLVGLLMAFVIRNYTFLLQKQWR